MTTTTPEVDERLDRAGRGPVRSGPPVGELLRKWREDRKLSQLTLAGQADISTRHLSFVETGRAQPSRDMVIKLAEHLQVPLRERNSLLLAAGFAPVYVEDTLDSARLAMVRSAVRQLLNGHEPYPAVAVDRSWNLVDANSAIGVFTDDTPEDLFAPPVNVLRFCLDPRGMARNIVNLAEWRANLLGRLGRQARSSDDPELLRLHEKLSADRPAGADDVRSADNGNVVLPLRIRHRSTELSLFSTTTVFGTPLDITVSELAIESFFPADQETAEYLRSLAEPRGAVATAQ